MEAPILSKYISDLLYEHDCVIVPNLGGFVTNYAPAKIHPAQHIFTPPSKSIVFNRQLKHNDGLLANHLASNLNIDFIHALRTINQFVNEINSELKSGKKVMMENVGTLYLDVERNIQFEPSTKNYLLEAYGLSTFQSSAIKRDALGKRLEKQLIDREPVASSVNRKKRIKRLITLTIAAPLIAALIWIPYKTNLFKADQASLNPFQGKQAVHIDSVASSFVTPDNVINDSVSLAVTIENTNNVTPVVADTTSVSINNAKTIEQPYHVVAGCFLVQENAVKYAEMLQQQNIHASIIGQNEKGLYVVSCGDYATRNDATAKLNELRNVSKGAWVYKKI